MKLSKNLPEFLVTLVNHPCCFSTKSFKNRYIEKILLEMPQDPKHVVEAQKQRIKIKEKSRNYVAGTVNLQVVGSGAAAAPTAVYLFTDQSRYLFNCGEGTQRLAHEHKTKLARLEHIFMTRTTWDRTGGLPGLSLTLQDAGVPNLTLHGPDGLGDLFLAMKRFVILKNLKVEAPVCEDGVIYDDQNLTIQAISFKRQTTDENLDKKPQSDSPSGNPVVDDTDYYALENNNENCEITNPSPPTVDIGTGLNKSHCGWNVMSFICRLKPRAGSLDLTKCLDKGVPPGPLLGQLKQGNSVILPDGTTVHANDVCSASDPGPIFILVDLPSVEFFENFMEKEHLFAMHQKTAECDDDVACLVLHMSPQNVIDTPVYQDFINKFAESTKHLVLNETNKFSGFVSAHRIQIQLNQINENIFPILGEYQNELESHDDTISNNKKFKFDESAVVTSTSETLSNGVDHKYEHISTSTYYHLRPNKGLDRVNEMAVCAEEYLAESATIPGFTESLDALKLKLRETYVNEKISRAAEYPRILFLGTGSCIPNKTRNVSAILVHTTPNSSILLDCGEGTFGQMVRFYGKDKVKEVLKNLKAIYVSHLHADHHLGLIGIIEERRRILGADMSPLMLLAPQQISSFLNFYDQRIESIRSEYFLVPNSNLLDEPLIDERTTELGLNFISTCIVRHCPHAFGIAFEINTDEPYKITYSGDTVPCHELVRLGKNSTLLIHEATMEDELEQQARSKMHSTVSQAIKQGVEMNAKFTLLTHFSQRYAKIPRIEGAMNTNVGIAFDNMEVTGEDLKYLHLLFPTLKILFSEHCELMENKAMKRFYKEQRAAGLVT